MKTARYDGDLQPLRDWINANYPAAKQSAQRRDDPPPEPFLSWAISHQPVSGKLKFWASKIRAGLEPDTWFAGFPHVHVWGSDVLTMILFVQAPQAGGEFGIGGVDKDDPYQFVTPEAGLAVFVDGDTWHGVKTVSEGERLAVIVTRVPG